MSGSETSSRDLRSAGTASAAANQAVREAAYGFRGEDDTRRR